jgi:hypothetical protein
MVQSHLLMVLSELLPIQQHLSTGGVYADSWYTYNGSGIIQPCMWHRSPPPPPRGEASGTWPSCRTNSRYSYDPNRSITHFLNIEDILRIDNYGHMQIVPTETMQQLVEFMDKHCHNLSLPPYSRDIEILQNPAVINIFVQLYFEHFHPVFPLSHKASFNMLEISTLLTLAVATIGSRFSRIRHAQRLAMALGEILRKAIDTQVSFA